jgi:flagellar biogenesis protein FliO
MYILHCLECWRKLYRDSEKASGKEERHATAAVACSDLFSILSSLVCFVLLFLIIIIYFVKKKNK